MLGEPSDFDTHHGFAVDANLKIEAGCSYSFDWDLRNRYLNDEDIARRIPKLSEKFFGTPPIKKPGLTPT